MLILSMGGLEIPKAVSHGGPGYQRKPCVLVVPFYGGDQDGSRAGFSPEFVERIKRIEYPQYIADTLPLGNLAMSIMRLDHVLAVGCAPSNFELMPHRLSNDALELVLDWFRWLVEGSLPTGSLLEWARSELMKMNA
ncbi:MAG: hypothetical protein V2A77_08175 [Pseudomonadota bacterium]